MNPSHLDLARHDLEAGNPARALDRLVGSDHPASGEAHRLRALAAAALGRPLAVRVALRDLAASEDPAPPASDAIARPLADAVLDHDPSRAQGWLLIAAAAGRDDVDEPALCAWNALISCSDGRSHDVLRLAALAHRLGRTDDATTLARGAQDAARHEGRADAFATSSWLLAALCRAAGDDELAEDVIRNAIRWVERLSPGAAEDQLDRSRRLVEAWTRTA